MKSDMMIRLEKLVHNKTVIFMSTFDHVSYFFESV